MNEDIQFLRMDKEKEVYSTNIWGNPFRIIIKRDEEGNIEQIFEKPIFKEIGAGIILLSGMHIFPNHPERNHIDWYVNREKLEVENTNMIPFWLNENNWMKQNTK